MRQSKTYKQSEWLVEGPEEMASLKADQAREVEDLKRRHEDEVENLKMKHEREAERQSKKDEAEAEREAQQEDTLPDIEDSRYLSELGEGKLVADDLMIIDSAVKSIKQEMVKSLKKNREAGVNFINSMFRSAGLKSKVSAKMQSKGRLFLKQEMSITEKDMTAISSWKKKLKKVKGLTKTQLQILSQLPTPVITSLINQVGMIVAGDELEEGLWDNIRAKRARGEKMRPKGAKGAPTDDQIKRAQEDKEEQDRDIKDKEGTQPKKSSKV